MSSALSCNRVCVSRASTSRQLARPQRASRTIVRAEEKEEPAYRTGFTDDDSAGQANIFAVEPKQYVAGSSKDSSSGNTVIVGGIAAVVAVALLAAGLAGNRSNPNTVPTTFEDAGKYQTLSYYKAKLSQ